MKKKLLTLALSLTLALGLTACGSPKVSGPVDREPVSPAVSSLQQQYASLEDWIDSDEKKTGVADVNKTLEPAGISVDLYAEGNVLIMEYTYIEQWDLEGLTQEDITAMFEETVLPAFSDMTVSMFDSFENAYGLKLDDIKMVYCNADGTELYSKYYSEL